MSISIVEKEAFSVIGILGEGNAANAVEWIQPLWQQAFARKQGIAHCIKPEAWGLMSGYSAFLSPWQDEGRYLAGWETNTDAIDVEDWDIWHVPAQRFATVECTLGNYREALEHLIHTISQHNLHYRSGAIHEFYPATFKNPEKDHLYLYMMIR